MKDLCKSRIKIHIERERESKRERERGRHKIVMFIQDISTTVTITIATTLTKGYKVTLYSDGLRATTLYTIYRNGLNLGCPKE